MSRKRKRKRTGSHGPQATNAVRQEPQLAEQPPRDQAGRRTGRRQRAARRRRQTWVTTALIAGIAVAFGGWLYSQSAIDPQVSEARLEQYAARGPADAPVSLVEYGDFNCPACRAYYQAGIIERILAEYPMQVRFEFHHFPVISPHSPMLAEAAECALDQGKFWEMHDLLYDLAPTTSRRTVKAYAAQLGLDTGTFDECLDTGRYADVVRLHTSAAFQLGFSGTPSFTLNGRRLAGPPTYDALSSMISSIVASN